MDKKYQPNGATNKTPHSGCAVTTNIKDDSIIIELAGEIDLGSSSKVYSLILQQCKQDDKPLIINLENINFMDSSGLQILLRLREKLLPNSRQILLVKPKPQIKKLFQLTGFDKMFHIFKDQSQALAFINYKKRQNS